MRKPSVKCSLLSAMVSKHRWGTPIDEEHLLAVAPIDPNEAPTARETFDELRSEPYIENRGKRGIELDNGAFDLLADVLYQECDWEAFEVKIRLKHYEGWERHDWA